VNDLRIVEELVAYFKRIAKPVNRRITGLFARLEKASMPQIIGFLFLYTFLIATPMLVGLQIDHDPERELDKDIKIFRDRAQTILDGELLYRDTEYITVTPPVINYLFVPAVLLGDTVFVWMAWFTFFLFLTSTVIYFILEPFFDKKTAIAGSMLFSGSPFGQYTSVAMLQDDAIIVAFLSLSLMFILRKKWYWAATMLSFGTMTKLFPALCSPLAVLGPESPLQRIKIAVYGLSIGLLISLPFLILAQTEFLQFIEFYLLGVQPTSSGNVSVTVSQIEQRGMSFWRFFAESVVMVPSILLHSILLLSLFMVWGMTWLKKIDMMSAFTLCILAVFIFYSKIHYGYHIMLLSVLIPWSMHDPKRLLGLFAASLLGGIVHFAWRDRLFTDNVWVHTLIAFALWCYWINWARIILQNPNFESYCGEKRTNDTVLITTGWIVIMCFIYTIQLGLGKIL